MRAGMESRETEEEEPAGDWQPVTYPLRPSHINKTPTTNARPQSQSLSSRFINPKYVLPARSKTATGPREHPKGSTPTGIKPFCVTSPPPTKHTTITTPRKQDNLPADQPKVKNFETRPDMPIEFVEMLHRKKIKDMNKLMEACKETVSEVKTVRAEKHALFARMENMIAQRNAHQERLEQLKREHEEKLATLAESYGVPKTVPEDTIMESGDDEDQTSSDSESAESDSEGESI